MSTDAYRLAGTMLGMDENAQNAALREFMANGGVNLDPAVTAWCAGFMNSAFTQTGGQSTGSLMARSFENWGQPVQNPQPGDVAVFHRNGLDSGQGHVGFFHGFDDAGNVLVLGGNQGNRVSVAPYSMDQLLGFRRAGDAPPGGAAPDFINALGGGGGGGTPGADPAMAEMAMLEQVLADRPPLMDALAGRPRGGNYSRGTRGPAQTPGPSEAVRAAETVNRGAAGFPGMLDEIQTAFMAPQARARRMLQ